MNCDSLKQHLSSLHTCVSTEDGLRLDTGCMLPSFEPVRVFVKPFGSGFKVHDNGCAFQSAWEHGRNEKVIKKTLAKEASRFRLKLENEILVAEAAAQEWLPSAILAVANAASQSAYKAVDHFVAAAEASLAERIYVALRLVFAESKIAKEYSQDGNSGKSHRFDFAVGSADGRLLLLDAVSPHHSSIAHKYTSFSDVKASLGSKMHGFAVYDRSLEADDAALMRQVADLVPIASVSEGARRAIQ